MRYYSNCSKHNSQVINFKVHRIPSQLKMESHNLYVLLTHLKVYLLFSYIFSVGVHVSVEDVNEYPPEWEGGASSVRVEIEEGQLLDHLIQVQAQDQDCSSKYGDVCGYHILQSDQQPFVISKEGKTCVILVGREILHIRAQPHLLSKTGRLDTIMD